jgi:ubiquinone/menaquinone biosynthesis C-methylase UbiE
VDQTTLAEISRVLRPDGQLLILDGGQVLDTRFHEAALHQVYRVTLPVQTGNPYAAALRRAGFQVDIEHLAVGRTAVGLVRATR